MILKYDSQNTTGARYLNTFVTYSFEIYSNYFWKVLFDALKKNIFFYITYTLYRNLGQKYFHILNSEKFDIIQHYFFTNHRLQTSRFIHSVYQLRKIYTKVNMFKYCLPEI